MGGGVFIGVFWGLVVSVLVTAILSLSAPLPPREGQAVDVSADMTETEAAAPDAAAEVATAQDVPDAGGASDAVAQGGLGQDDEAQDTPIPEVALDADLEVEEMPPAPAADEVATAETAPDAQPVAPDPAAEAETSVARQGPAEAIPLPAGSEFNRPPPEEAAVLPQVDRAPGVEAPRAPPAPETSLSGGIDTAPPPQPRVVPAPASPGPLASAPEEIGGLGPTDELALATDDAPPRAGAAPPASVPAPGLESGALPDVTDPPRPVTPPVATTDAEQAGTASDPAAGTAPPAASEPESEAADGTPDAVPGDPDGAEQAPVETAEAAVDAPDAAAPAPADMAAETAPEAPPETAAPPEAGAAEAQAQPPAVVRLVPPRADAPAHAAGDPEDAAADAADAEPQAGSAMGAVAPRVIRPGASPDRDTGDAASVVLPQIVNPGRVDPAPDVDADPPAAEAAPDPEEPAPRPAIEAFAAPFEAPEARALISVVLIDEPDPRLGIETLTSFGIPVAFAIDPSRPDAAERAAAYRAAGFEVLMLGTVIPEGATAADTEVALAAARARVPEAIALMDTVESRIQSDRSVLEAVVGIAAGEGQGLVAFPRGLNTAEQMAARADVPAATLFRLLDDEDQRATVITRYLSRAEFAAAQEGAVIVAGRTRPATVTALFSWALGERNAGVVIAPVSAALARLAEAE